MLEDVRECPGTMGLAASWVLVFGLILLVQWQSGAPVPPSSMVGPLPASTVTTHRFGDLTWAEVRRGEAWRLETATFVHYSLMHLGMNVMSLVMLGRLVEPWYGPGPFLAICLAIGGLGNLVGGALRVLVAGARPWVATSGLSRLWPGLVDRLAPGGPVNIHTGGGSTILLGLLGLAAVVGWRSRTRIGAFLSRQMVVLLGFTAVLGLVFSNLVDNYGHAGGAIVGAAIGFLHRPLVRLSGRLPARRLAWAGVAALSVACLAAAVRDDRAETGLERRLAAVVARGRASEQALADLERLYQSYGRTILRAPVYRDPLNELDAYAVFHLMGLTTPAAPPAAEPAQLARERAEVEATLGRLGQLPAGSLWGDPVAADLDRIRTLGLASLDDDPRYDQVYEFVVCCRAVAKVLAADLAQSRTRLIELDRQAQEAR